jgi:hypothetical protein
LTVLSNTLVLLQHASIVTYRTKGVAGFEKCLFQLAPIQLYTVLRNPVEKWWSGVYFWKKVWHVLLFSKSTITRTLYLIIEQHKSAHV